jgi:hypothetical protein
VIATARPSSPDNCDYEIRFDLCAGSFGGRDRTSSSCSQRAMCAFR